MDDDDLEIMELCVVSVSVIALVQTYIDTYIERLPCMTSPFIGDIWMGELLRGHPQRFHNMFRMSKIIFLDLLNELQNNHGLHGSSRTTSREVLGITLFILSHNESIRATSERFQHSTETISRYFALGLESLVSLSRKIIKPVDANFVGTPKEILQDTRYMPYFKDCIGAIDGTHVDARVPNDRKIAFIGRSGRPTQNVMAACDFNMCFTFVMAGWEGTAHDSRIFRIATRTRRHRFPLPPQGRYYLVDAGYPMQRGFLTPYPDTKYHIPDFAASGNVPRGRKELFNKRHSSLRGVIERTFGVWKKKWVILKNMPTYPFEKQVKIVVGTMTVHNFIRRHTTCNDVEFNEMEQYDLRVPLEGNDDNDRNINDDDEIFNNEAEGAYDMKVLRENITDALQQG